ncbi:MAG: hypothetical protein NT159_19445 [Proteobacteria bacterium]|nr:hypothetical protein [Pseudomonadota bacterium]
MVDHDPICIGPLTPVTLSLQGWGYVSITAHEHPNWPGLRNTFVPGRNVLTFVAPTGANLRIRCGNLFGWVNAAFAVRERNMELGTFNLPDVKATSPRVVINLPRGTGWAREIFAKRHRWLTPRMGAIKLAKATIGNVSGSVCLQKGEVFIPSGNILYKPIRLVIRRKQIQPWIEDRHSS